mmetsp:Transcript_9211/g.20706  ORF Transcript_9211/g.20706 Transcript_9211/m.20706 type:complete len:168 (+) Transcript_9211:415-918(+)
MLPRIYHASPNSSSRTVLAPPLLSLSWIGHNVRCCFPTAYCRDMPARCVRGHFPRRLTCATLHSSAVPATIASAGWDLVVAADCVFWPELWLPLLNTLAAITNGRPRATPPPRVLLTIVDRLGRARAFCDATHAAGWALERIDKPILCQQPVAIQSPELYELRWVGE